MHRRNIPVMSAAEFEHELSVDPGMLDQHPCVVHGLIDGWAARANWQDTGMLAQRFGHLPVNAGAPQFITHARATICEVRTTYAKYLAYVDAPQLSGELFDGEWTRGDHHAFLRQQLPLYSGSIRFVNRHTDPLLDELRALTPPALEILNDEIPYFYQTRNHAWLYVALAGALTPLHEDNNGVIAFLAQLAGRKRATLFHPADRQHYFNPHVGYMDVLKPDSAEFPTAHEAVAWEASLEAGQLLIWGPDWAHHVVTEQRSITLSHDIVNRSNLDRYTGSVDWMKALGQMAAGSAIARSVAADGCADEAWRLGREVMRHVLETSLARDLPARTRDVRQRMLQQLDAVDVMATADTVY